eukprot:SAG11_NODE_2916_length_2840_cov_13.306457_4_plen_57_part_00
MLISGLIVASPQSCSGFAGCSCALSAGRVVAHRGAQVVLLDHLDQATMSRMLVTVG